MTQVVADRAFSMDNALDPNDGFYHRVVVPDSALLSSSSEWSFAVWVRQDRLLGAKYILGHGADDADNRLLIGCENPGRVRAYFSPFASGFFTYVETPDGSFTAGAFHLLVVTWGPSTAAVYIDGDVEPLTTTGTLPAELRDTSQPFTLGATRDVDSAGSWNGDMHNAIVWRRTLTPDEVQMLWRGTVPDGYAAWWPLNEGKGTVARDRAGASDGAYVGEHLSWCDVRPSDPIEFVGDFSQGPFAQNRHSGIRGNSISNCQDRVETVLSTYDPTIVMLHIGINDALLLDTDDFMAQWETLARTILEYSSSPHFLPCLLFRPSGASHAAAVAVINPFLRALFRRLQRECWKITPIDWYTAYDSSWAHDAFHPNDEGYWFMAQVAGSIIKSQVRGSRHRLLLLGDSITKGSGSADNIVGFRLPLSHAVAPTAARMRAAA